MIMWIAAIVLVALTAGVGYRQGATRAAFTFVGLMTAAALAIPLSTMFYWVFPLIGFKNPVAPKFGAPIIAFFVVLLAIKSLAEFVHRKIDYHYRYNRDDATRAVWEMMHSRVGACLGALNGMVYFLVFALIVSVFGYFTIQTGGGESNSKILSFLGKSAEDLQSTKMDKVVAAFNPGGTNYFETADVLGLLYHNRNLIDRLYDYPVFAAMAEEPVYKNLGTDKELQALIRGQSGFSEIWDHPKISEVVSNTDIVTKVLELDIQDVKQYLETGVSPKYSQEKILGHWRYDLRTTLELNKSLRPEVPVSAWRRIRSELTERFDGTVFTAFHDNKAKLVLSPRMAGRSSPMDPGVRLANGTTNFVPRWATTNALSSATGKWSGAAPNYLVTLTTKEGGSATGEGKLQDNRLSFEFAGKAFSFTKVQN